MRDNDLLILGDRVRVARRIKGWSQEELAERASLDRSYIGGVERGERNITISTLMSLCRALECEAQDVVQGLPLQNVQSPHD